MVLNLNDILEQREAFIDGILLLFGRAAGGRFGPVTGMRVGIADIRIDGHGEILLIVPSWTSPVIEFGKELKHPRFFTKGVYAGAEINKEFGLDTTPLDPSGPWCPLTPFLAVPGQEAVPLYRGLDWQSFCIFRPGEFDRVGASVFPGFKAPVPAS